ncbi:hypothetical protein NQ317_008502 [Molorchus minor]|uniref:Uncharacterized protein n=1 Tax=Molorchus minor TaxID=1323400 RepID=A0ABQ9JMG2_9CUCU|nr:hypothetical protein NQ317_008502 [Molorchus minor]
MTMDFSELWHGLILDKLIGNLFKSNKLSDTLIKGEETLFKRQKTNNNGTKFVDNDNYALYNYFTAGKIEFSSSVGLLHFCRCARIPRNRKP